MFRAKSRTSRQYIFNPCGGWGDRLVGALAIDSVLRYIETDPNLDLLPMKKQLLEKYKSTILEKNRKKLMVYDCSSAENSLIENTDASNDDLTIMLYTLYE